MSAVDPIMHIPNLAPAPVFLQFGNDDFHVPLERADEFLAAAGTPKEMKVYEAVHGLNEEATKDKKEWLRKHLSP